MMKTPSKCIHDIPSRGLQDVLKTKKWLQGRNLHLHPETSKFVCDKSVCNKFISNKSKTKPGTN